MQIVRYVTLPIMFRTVLPSLSNTFISLFKDTSLAMAIAVPELTFVTRKVGHRYLPVHPGMDDGGSSLPRHHLRYRRSAPLPREAHSVDGLREARYWKTVIQELPLLLQGVAVTLQISALVIVAGSIIGIFGGLGLLYGPLWLRSLLRGYVDIVRGLPLLVTIFIIFYVPPAFDIEVSGFAAVTVALSIFAGAHISEIVRGAVASVSRGQNDAAKALGLTFWPRIWNVILPQALPAIIPPWTNTAVEMVKGSSLAYLVSVSELLFQTYKVVGRTGAAMPLYIAAALLYFAINFALSRAGSVARAPDSLHHMRLPVEDLPS